MAKKLKITGFRADYDLIRNIKLVGLSWVDNATAHVKVCRGTDGHLIELLLYSDHAGMKRLELENCISLMDIPSAQIETSLLTKAIIDEEYTAKNILWALFSAIIAATATLNIEWTQEMGKEEIVFTLTLGKYISVLCCPPTDLKQYLAKD